MANTHTKNCLNSQVAQINYEPFFEALGHAMALFQQEPLSVGGVHAAPLLELMVLRLHGEEGHQMSTLARQGTKPGETLVSANGRYGGPGLQWSERTVSRDEQLGTLQDIPCQP